MQIKSAAWKYHACLPAKAPTSLNMTKVADGLLAFPLEGTGGARGKKVRRIRYPGNLEAAHLPQIIGRNNNDQQCSNAGRATNAGKPSNHASILNAKTSAIHTQIFQEKPSGCDESGMRCEWK